MLYFLLRSALSCTDFCLYGIFANCGRTAAFSVSRRGALPRGLRVTGSKLCRCRILAALWVCSRRHPVVPRGGGGTANPTKRGFPPLPCVCLWAAASVPPLCGKHFHVLVNPLGFTLRTLSLSPLPLSPLWKMAVEDLFFLGIIYFAFGVRLCGL